MAAEEQNTENESTFVFKEVGAETNEGLTNPDVVEIKEEVVEEVENKQDTPPEEDKNKEEVKNEEKKPVEEDGQQEEVEEEEDEVSELDEDLAYNYLKEKRGLEFDTFEDFLKSREAKKVDPEFEKYQEYKAKTGRGYGDFLETQKDWSSETPESLIKAALKLENPDLSSDDIDFLFDKDYAFDEDIDDDYDIKSKKISLKVDSKRALAVLEKQKEDYMVDRGSDEDSIPAVYKDAKDLVEQLYDEQVENEEKSKKSREAFVSKTVNTLNEKFDGFKFSIEGQDYKVKPENIKETREAQLDIANFQKKFFDKENNLTDPEGYHKALYLAMNPEKAALHFFNLGKTAYAEHLEKESKNIDVKGDKHIPSPELSAFTFKKVN